MEKSNKTYWLNLFTGTTWKEFRAAGATISGFRASRQKLAAKIQPGDVFLCYLTGVMRWVGAVEVLGPSQEKHAIWSQMSFPVQFEVKPLILLEPETGVPMAHLKGLTSFYANDQDAGKFKAFLRGSPNRFQSPEDAAVILGLLEQAQAHPERRPVSQAKLQRKPSTWPSSRSVRRRSKPWSPFPTTRRRRTAKTLGSWPGKPSIPNPRSI